MDVQLVDNETVTEPISLEEAKAYLQIDADYSTTDDDVTLALTAARQRLEQYLNIGLARREVKVYWDGRQIELPLSPNGDIVSVKNGDDTLATTDYTVVNLPAKRVSVNSATCWNGSWFYSLSGYVEFTPSNTPNNTVYECTYQTGYETLPTALKQAILAETTYLFNLKGSPVTDVISPNAAMLANGYSRNLIL